MRWFLSRAVWMTAAVGCLPACDSWFGNDGGPGKRNQSLYPSDCIESCVAGCGQSNGCGGLCGCDGGLFCSAEGRCVPEGSCTDTCQSTGWSCGNVCGTVCGACAAEQVCIDGGCLAATDVSCAECPLRLEVVGSERDAGGRLTQVTLALVYAPAEGAARPRIADFRLRADRAVTLLSAELGEGLRRAGKELFVDPVDATPWKELTEGEFQLLVMSRANTNRFESGELLRLRFGIDAQVGAASFRLMKRDEVFAPAEANNVVQPTAYDAPVVVH